MVTGILTNFFRDNSKHRVEVSRDHEFLALAKGQSPRATVVMCSDSRVQTHMMDATPINDIFTVRSIGNTFETALGSIKYGVLYVETPLLMFVGHSNCGAVKAKYDGLDCPEAEIMQELEYVELGGGQSFNDSIVHNVNEQVAKAMRVEAFAELVHKEELMIAGALYDFSNCYGCGHGRLIMLNVNGVTDPMHIRKHPWMPPNVHDTQIGLQLT